MSVQEVKNKSTVIGLTGGIACGKSMISAYFAQKGIPVIDGDLVARQIVEPGTKGLAQIVDTFGAEYLHADGTLNRAMLGSRVFADIDAVVYTGDNVMNGQFLENLFFYSAVKAVNPAENNIVLVGNHDLGNGAGDHVKSRGDFITNNNLYLGNKIDDIYYYRVINGCYMICIATEVGDPSRFEVSDEQYLWLEGVLKEAKEADAPVFVFAHFPIRDISQGGAKFAELLKQYNVALYAHGHYHNDLVSGNFYNWGGINSVNLPRATETKDYEGGDGIVVEVYENEILVRGRDFIKGEWIDGLEYTYSIG